MKLCRLITWTSHTKLLVAATLCLILAATAGQAQAAYTEDGNYYPDPIEAYSEAVHIAPLFLSDEDLTTVTQNGITYELDSTRKTAEVAGYTADIPAACVIPATITDDGQTYSVVGIREGGLYNCSAITSLTIPEGVKEIGWRAMTGCTNLQEVSLPHSIIYVGYYAFQDCTSLQAINVVEGNSSYYSVDGVLFFKNSYEGTTELLKYPEGRTDRSYMVPDGVSIISNNAFYGTYEIQKVTLSNSVRIIEDSAFEDCYQLEFIDFGEGLQTVERNSFDGTQLKSISLPMTLSELSAGAFHGCRNISSITVAEGNTRFFSDGIGLYEKTTDGFVFCLYAPAAENSFYAVKEGTKKISENAFSDAENITSLDLPEGLQEIGWGGFTDISVAKLILPDTVTVIEPYTFQNCYKLQEVSLGSIQNIPEGAFYACNSLESILIPETVQTIEERAFTNCGSLMAVDVAEENEYYLSNEGVLFNKEETELLLYPSAKMEHSYTVPKNVTHIGYGAFQGVAQLESIDVESGSTTYYAEDGILFERSGQRECNSIFEGRTLEEDTLDFGVSLHTFPLGKTIESYTLPNNVKTIAPRAFFKNSSLKKLYINNAQYVGDEAFSDTENLKSVECLNLVCIGRIAFINSGIEHIDLPSTLRYISTQAFDYCSDMKYITFVSEEPPENSVLTAYHCWSLRYVYVPFSEDGSVQASYARSFAGKLKPGTMIVTGKYIPKDEVAKKITALNENSTKSEVNETAISLVRLTPEDMGNISDDSLKKVDDLFSKTNGIQVCQEAKGSYATQVTVSGAAVASGLTESIARGESVENTTVTVNVQEETPSFREIYRLNFTMLVDGQEKELQSPIVVRLPKPEGISEDMLCVYHFMGYNKGEPVNYRIVGDEIEFRADSFSSYALLSMAEKIEYTLPENQNATLVVAYYDFNGKMTACTTTPVQESGFQIVSVGNEQFIKVFLLGEENQPVGTVTIRDWRPSGETGEAGQ